MSMVRRGTLSSGTLLTARSRSRASMAAIEALLRVLVEAVEGQHLLVGLRAPRRSAARRRRWSPSAAGPGWRPRGPRRLVPGRATWPPRRGRVPWSSKSSAAVSNSRAAQLEADLGQGLAGAGQLQERAARVGSVSSAGTPRCSVNGDVHATGTPCGCAPTRPRGGSPSMITAVTSRSMGMRSSPGSLAVLELELPLRPEEEVVDRLLRLGLAGRGAGPPRRGCRRATRIDAEEPRPSPPARAAP